MLQEHLEKQSCGKSHVRTLRSHVTKRSADGDTDDGELIWFDFRLVVLWFGQSILGSFGLETGTKNQWSQAVKLNVELGTFCALGT